MHIIACKHACKLVRTCSLAIDLLCVYRYQYNVMYMYAQCHDIVTIKKQNRTGSGLYQYARAKAIEQTYQYL